MMLSVSSIGYANQEFGACNFIKEKVSSVICYGPTILNETIVTGDVKVAGTLKASKVLIGSMTINGSADIQNARVSGLVNVKGYMHASFVNFENDLRITTTKLDFDHTSVKGSVTISSDKIKPYFKIECGSDITGSVTFEGVPGVVQMTDDSAIHGKINNGEIEFVKTKC